MLRILLALLLLVAPGMAEACTPIRFARGATSAIIRGMASSAEPTTCFTLETAAGQTARLRLVRSDADVAFTIRDVVDNRYEHSFRTSARSYEILVYHMRGRDPGSLPFTLEVSVR